MTIQKNCLNNKVLFPFFLHFVCNFFFAGAGSNPPSMGHLTCPLISLISRVFFYPLPYQRHHFFLFGIFFFCDIVIVILGRWDTYLGYQLCTSECPRSKRCMTAGWEKSGVRNNLRRVFQLSSVLKRFQGWILIHVLKFYCYLIIFENGDHREDCIFWFVSTPRFSPLVVFLLT